MSPIHGETCGACFSVVCFTLPACLPACLSACLPACLPACSIACLLSCMRACVRASAGLLPRFCKPSGPRASERQRAHRDPGQAAPLLERKPLRSAGGPDSSPEAPDMALLPKGLRAVSLCPALAFCKRKLAIWLKGDTKDWQRAVMVFLGGTLTTVVQNPFKRANNHLFSHTSLELMLHSSSQTQG